MAANTGADGQAAAGAAGQGAAATDGQGAAGTDGQVGAGAADGHGLSRRRLGARLLALGGVLVLHAALPGSAGEASGNPAERR
ncbi:serine hydrolase, partial [Streptomyces sp. NPDC059385]